MPVRRLLAWASRAAQQLMTVLLDLSCIAGARFEALLHSTDPSGSTVSVDSLRGEESLAVRKRLLALGVDERRCGIVSANTRSSQRRGGLRQLHQRLALNG
jgi:hypothetical protein